MEQDKAILTESLECRNQDDFNQFIRAMQKELGHPLWCGYFPDGTLIATHKGEIYVKWYIDERTIVLRKEIV